MPLISFDDDTDFTGTDIHPKNSLRLKKKMKKNLVKKKCKNQMKRVGDNEKEREKKKTKIRSKHVKKKLERKIFVLKRKIGIRDRHRKKNESISLKPCHAMPCNLFTVSFSKLMLDNNEIVCANKVFAHVHCDQPHDSHHAI